MTGLTAGLMLSFLFAQSPSQSPSTTQPATATPLEVQRVADAPGDRRAFLSETDLAVSAPAGDGRQVNRQRFEIETLAAAPGGLTLRFRLVEASLTDSWNPDLEPLLKAWIGVDVDFSADAAGRPLGLMDWPSVRDAYAARLAAAGMDETARTRILAGLDDLPSDSRVSMLLGDVALLAEMQPRRPLVAGRFDQPVERRDAFTRSSTLSVSPSPDGCGLSLTRSTTLQQATASGPADMFRQEATARLHVVDGWVSEVTRTTTQSGRANSVETVRVSRYPQPGCPAA